MEDPFAILGLEPSFDLDSKLLGQRHRELSKMLHPDRFASGASGERRLAIERAIAVNEAFRKLSDPVSRGEELLRRLGADLSETTEPAADPELLSEMLEAREQLAVFSRIKDKAGVARLGQRLGKQRDAAVLDFARQFAALPGSGKFIAPSDLVSLRRKLGELRYYRRFFDEVRAIEDELI